MRNLFINEIRYKIKTVEENHFGASVRFKPGLNIVYGPNSLGKTSIVNGLIYALGAEKSFGIFKSDQNPFKPEFYDKIDGEKILQSFILLEVSNGTQTITIARSIIGKTKVAGIKKCKIQEFDDTKKIEYLVASGEGVADEGGLQYYLFDFLNISMESVPTYENKTSKIYLENITPLFFVEQRAGWSQIQARQVTRYGIRDVKKVVFEYLMGLDRFHAHIIEIKIKEVKEKIRKNKQELNDREEEIIVTTKGDKDQGTLIVERGDIGKTSIYDAIKYLEQKYEKLISNLEKLNTQRNDDNKREESQRSKLNKEEYKLRKATQHANTLQQEINGYKNYLERILVNKKKNDQLKRIENISLSLNIHTCPVCESNLSFAEEDKCNLCHSELKRKVSTPEQNISFLEDEEKSFKSILRTKELEIRKVRHEVTELRHKVSKLEDDIDHSTRTYVGSGFEEIRLKVAEIDDVNNEIKKLKWASRKWEELNYLRRKLESLTVEKNKLEKRKASIKDSERDDQILKMIKDKFQANVRVLELFRNKENLIDRIKLDEADNYTPYLEDYDIYNIISSSDNVRIMLGYYLSLLQASLEFQNDELINFLNLLIFDEPKQQNLDNESLKLFIKLIEEINTKDYQVIMTTYTHVEKEREIFEKYICHEMKDKSDYLIKRID